MDLNRHFKKQIGRWPNKHMERFTTSLVIREKQIKPTSHTEQPQPHRPFGAAVPNLFVTRDQFHGKQFFHEPGVRGGGFRVI